MDQITCSATSLACFAVRKCQLYNKFVPCAPSLFAKDKSVNRRGHSIRRPSQKSHYGHYGCGSSFFHFRTSFKEHEETEESQGAFFLPYLEIRLFKANRSSWKSGNMKERMWFRSNSTLKLFCANLGMAKGFLRLLKNTFSPGWCQSVSQRLSHSCILLGYMLFLHSAALSLKGAPALAEQIVRPYVPLDLSNMEVVGNRLNGFTNELPNEPPVLAVPRMDDAAMVVNAWSSQMLGVAPSENMVIFTISENVSMCKESYGIFPCSNSLTGNLFLMFVYGSLLLMAAKLISEGSELLLEVLNPGLIGGLLLPILGALPDAALIFASGAGSTVEEAQQEVLVGVGVLAGSTSMLLTVAWSGSLVAGRCDLSGPGGTAKDLTLTRGFDLLNTGVTVDEQTRWGAYIMMISAIPYVCAQVPLLDGHPEEGPVSALAGCILALIGLLAYCAYQIASPWLQKKQIEEARLQLLRSSALQGISSFSSNSMISSALQTKEVELGPLPGLLQEIFLYFDKNKDGKIEEDELRGLILALNIEEGYIPPEKQVETWLNEFDKDADGMLSENEFLLGIQKWAHQVARQKEKLKFQRLKNSMAGTDPNFWGTKLEEAKMTLNLLESEVENNDDDFMNEGFKTPVIDPLKLYQKAVLLLVSGAALAAIFSDPLIDSIEGFSTASMIPPFFVAYVVVPFTSNAGELYSSIVFAARRRKRNMSLTFSQIYGAVSMNNTLCLGIFLGLVWTRGLIWDFSSEVTVVLLNVMCVGLTGVSSTTFPLWYAIPVFSFYFVTLGGVALLDTLLGWH